MSWTSFTVISVPLITLIFSCYYAYRFIKKEKLRDQKLVDEADYLKEAIKKSNCLRLQGNQFFTDGKYEEAIDCYSQAIELLQSLDANEEMSMLFQNRAACYEALEEWEKCLSDCSESLLRNPRHSKALVRRSRMYELKEMYQEALVDMTTACLLERFHNEQHVKRASQIIKEYRKSVMKSVLFDKISQPIRLPSHEFIRTYFQSFEWDPLQYPLPQSDPNEDTSHMLASSPTNTTPRFVIRLQSLRDALIELQNHKYNDAMERIFNVFNQMKDSIENCSINNSHDCLLAYLTRGTFYYLAFRNKEALSDFKRVINDTERLMSRTLLGDLRYIHVNALIRFAQCQHKDSNQVLTAYKRAISLWPYCSDIFAHRGQFLLLTQQADNYKMAICDFQVASELSVKKVFYRSFEYHTQILLYLMKNKLDSALNEWNQWNNWLSEFPQSEDILILQAQTLCQLELYELAINHLQSAQLLRPDNPNILVRLAMMKKLHGNEMNKDNRVRMNNEIMRLLKRAIFLDRQCLAAHEALALVYTENGDLESALKCYSLAIEEPQQPKQVANLIVLREMIRTQIQLARQHHITHDELSQMRSAIMEHSTQFNTILQQNELAIG